MNSILIIRFLLVVAGAFPLLIKAQSAPENIKKWKDFAGRVTIIRDQWDIPHIFGKSDADAVFGLMYAQAEDDFDRVERNYIEVLGRKAEAFGEQFLYEDLRQRLFIDTNMALQLYQKSPEWLKKLMDAWADGLNYYLYKNPSVKPRLISQFKPWMPLMFSEGSIGGDISTVSAQRLQAFYGKKKQSGQEEGRLDPAIPDGRGSNGIAVGPSRSASGNAMLLINPHTTFFFRTEVHMVSEEGLNAYGAVTWGQFFIYQGFNENCGWMHTSSSTDVIDEYLEEVNSKKPYMYKHGNDLKPVITKKVEIKYLTKGKLESRYFETYFTHHGPVTGKKDNNWITTSLMNNPLDALQQSFLRTKSNGFNTFQSVMQLRTNSSNNTMFADREGNIAYWQGNFIPKRSTGVKTRGLLNGSDPDNDWQGTHELSEIIQFKNPPNGWLQNCNSSPYYAAGNNVKLPAVYPDYMGSANQNFRAVNAIRQLDADSVLSLDEFIGIAYNRSLPAFEILIPALMEAIKSVAVSDADEHRMLKEAYTVFEPWDATWSANSVATTLAIGWGLRLYEFTRQKKKYLPPMDDLAIMNMMANQTADTIITRLLIETMRSLEKDFGNWRTPWGELNRFQRITGAADESFSDAKPSFPVPFASAFWGSLATCDGIKPRGAVRQYGISGNSFVAVVEFGRKVNAYTIIPGGHSSNPQSVNFNDQTQGFITPRLKKVNFYRDELEKVAVRIYQPGF